MKKYRSYREPWTTPWKVFFDRLQRGDLNWIQVVWVCLMLVCTASCSWFLLDALINYMPRSTTFWGNLFKIGLFGSGWLISKYIYAMRKYIGGRSLSLAITNLEKTLNEFRFNLLIILIIRALTQRPKIKTAPGTRLLSVVEFLYSPKTVEEVFKPIIADWRTEYFEALEQNRTLKAGWISLRYKYHFGMAMGVSRVYSLFRSVLSVLSAKK